MAMLLLYIFIIVKVEKFQFVKEKYYGHVF